MRRRSSWTRRSQRGPPRRRVAVTAPAAVLTISNIGASVLVYTPHRVFAGPYHRNTSGNLLALDAFTGTPEQTQALIHDNRIGIVAICRGNDETSLLASLAPAGFLAAVVHGKPPDWLEKLPQANGEPLELYRVRP